MKEPTVTIEQAKSLKVLGFDWKCFHCWVEGDDGPFLGFGGGEVNFNESLELTSAPTLAHAHQWLQNTFSLDIEIQVIHYRILGTPGKISSRDYKAYIVFQGTHYSVRKFAFQNYEEALSKSIDFAINLLINKQK